jgi:hypothetical protein
MSRRLILATCLVAVVGGGAGIASAAGPVQSGPVQTDSTQHELCVVLAKDPAHDKTQYYCVNWWAPQR